MRFLVTAGPTREHWDAVRFLSNPSTGKMGFALAQAARRLSRQVTLVSGPTSLRPPRGVRCLRVVSAREMFACIKRLAPRADVVLMAAAVSDYRPARRLGGKLKKSDRPCQLKLVANPDILAWLGRRKRPGQILVGFAAETGLLLRHARAKLRRKNLDLIVANDVTARGSGFAADTNRVILLWRGGGTEPLPRASKRQVARWIVHRVVRHAKMVAAKD